MLEPAWNLGAQPELVKLRHWAHTLGFGGHWLTKSRRYSVTGSGPRTVGCLGCPGDR
jgi:hypothetical protein